MASGIRPVGDWQRSTQVLLGPHSVSTATGDAHLRLRKVILFFKAGLMSHGAFIM